MSATFFISYSREEAPFVDALIGALEDDGHKVWADYRNLTPGKPWLEQIYAGIAYADIFLLVVSRDSIASDNVKAEYERALEKDKRIILAVFEPAELPYLLRRHEWVDFRGSFREGYDNLMGQIYNPAKPKKNAPQSGFRLSSSVWLALALSMLAVLISLPAWWTLYLPLLLIPLPLRIIKRDFNFYRARFAAVTMPPALLLTAYFFSGYERFAVYTIFCVFAACVLTPVLVFALASKGMRVWGKAGSSIPKFANQYKPEIERPEPTPYHIEYAPQDKKYANAIIEALTEYEHLQTSNPEEAKVSFAVMSNFKNSTGIDPEKNALFPVLVQNADIQSKSLQRVQWIDFRQGLRNLDALAMLLPFPLKMMKALGLSPVNRQELYPRAIQILEYYLQLLGCFSLSVWIPLALELGAEFYALDHFWTFAAVNLFFAGLTLAILIPARRALLDRQGWFASPMRIMGAILLIGLISFGQSAYVIQGIVEAVGFFDVASRGSIALFLPVSFSIGLATFVVIAVWNRTALLRWFPAQA